MMTIARHGVTLTMLTLLAGCATAPPVETPPPVRIATPVAADDAAYADEIREIEQMVARLMQTEGAVGLTIGFAKDDFVWAKGFGYADLENKVPAKAESSYRMASVTKPMTAVGILTLVEQGKVDLDTEVQKYVEYFPRKANPVTIRQLLGHLGGISHYRNYDLEGHFREPMNTRESLAVFEDFDLVAEPGTRYGYTSYGFNLLGAVIEEASGQPYGEFMTEHVWKPLGMHDTRMDDPRAIIPHRVEGYEMVGGELRRSEYVDISSRFAGGGTRSTVPDMLRFAQGLWEGEVLSDETRSRMWTAQSTREGRNVGYGFGWGTNTGNGRFVVGHGGAQAETRTYLLVAPNERFAAAVAINFESSDSAEYAFRLFEIVMDEPWQIRYWARTEKERALLRGMDTAFDFGMRHYDQFGEPLTSDRAALRDAFDYFNAIMSLPEEEASQRLQHGVHPAANEAFVAMVSHIAHTLDANDRDLDLYYSGGVIPMFADYIAWYRAYPGQSAGLTFDPSFEQMIQRWNADWARTWTAETSDIDIDAATDTAMLRDRLGSAFEGASVYPDYSGDLAGAMRTVFVQGDAAKAFDLARTAVELYPESDDTNANLAVLYIVTGDEESAKPLMRKSLELDPDGAAGPGNLNRLAYELASAGQPEAGLRLLMAAIRAHPNVANLYDSVGEFHHELGRPQQAIDYYSRALEIDPEYPNAENARRIVEELRSE